MKERIIWASTDIWDLWGSEEEQLKTYNDFALDADKDLKDEIDDEAYDYLQEIVADDWNNMLDTAIEVDDIAITGSLGLWDGRHNIEPEREKNLRSAILRCTHIRGDWNAMVYFDRVDYDDDEHLFISVSHHDGTNVFELKKITNPDADEEEWKTIPISRKMVWE